MSEILDLKIYNFQNNQYNHIVLSVKIGMILKKRSIQTYELQILAPLFLVNLQVLSLF